MADDPMLREMACDPKLRKVLVTDGKSAVGQALFKALANAGADLFWVGHAEPWKKLPGVDTLAALPQVSPDAEVARFLVEQRNVLGFGSEAIGTDAGQGCHLRPPYPCHYCMHGAGRCGLQCLSHLDWLPPTGALLICPPLKIEKGSGSPLRVLALVGT